MKRRASVASRRAYASAPTRVAWKRPAAGDHDAARQHLVALVLGDRIGLAGEHRLVELEAVDRQQRSRRPAPGRRRGARTGRRARLVDGDLGRLRRRARRGPGARSSTASRSSVRFARYSCTTPMSVLNSSTKPKSASWPSPKTRISTNIGAEDRVEAREHVGPDDLAERAARALVGDVDLAGPRPAAPTSAAVQPVRVRWPRPAPPDRCRSSRERYRRPACAGEPVHRPRDRYRGAAHDHREQPTTCYRHPDRETGPALHPLRAARVPRVPARGVGRLAVRRMRQGGGADDARNGVQRHSRATRTCSRRRRSSASHVAAFVVIGLRDGALRRRRAHRARTSCSSAARAPGRVVPASSASPRALRRLAHLLQHAACSGSSARSSSRAPDRCGSRSSTSCRCWPGSAGALVAQPHVADAAVRRAACSVSPPRPRS